LPSIAVDITAAPESVPETGADVAFVVTVINNSPEAAQLTELTDSVYDNLLALDSCATTAPVLLAGNDTYTCTFSRLLAANFGSAPQQNTVQAAAMDIELTQTASASSLPESGDTLAYTLTVANRSPADAITITQLTSSEFGDVSAVAGPIAATDCDLPLDLERDETATCHFTAFTIGNANQTVAHRVTSSGIDDDDDSVEASSSTAITFTDLPSSLTISATISTKKKTNTMWMKSITGSMKSAWPPLASGMNMPS